MEESEMKEREKIMNDQDKRILRDNKFRESRDIKNVETAKKKYFKERNGSHRNVNSFLG
jgi:hypothetical protein